MAAYSDSVKENVAFLGDRAREMAADEADRSKVLDTKAAGVVAASVALTGAAAGFAARLHDLQGGPGAKLLWAIELAAAMVLLLTAGGLAVWSLAPKSVRSAVHVDELERWSTPIVLEDDATRIAGTMLRASVHSIGYARTVNNRKADRLRWASAGLGAGLACIVLLAASLAAHAVRQASDEREARQAPRAGASGGLSIRASGAPVGGERADVPAAENGPRAPARVE